MQLLIEKRTKTYTNIYEIRNVGVSEAALEKLAYADAFMSMNLNRRQALWEVSALEDRPVALFSDQRICEEIYYCLQ